MKFKTLSITLAITVGMSGIGLSVNTPTASAKSTSFPVHMRGTWHSYSYSHFDTIKITKHTYHYYGSPKISANKLDLMKHPTSHGKTAYVPRFKRVHGAYAYYIQGRVNWHGHHYYALYSDGGVYTHHKIKHTFKLPRAYYY